MGFGKDGKGAIIKELTTVSLGTLDINVALIFTGPIALEENFRILKTQVIAYATGLTSGEGNGLVLGIANGELAASEIEESIEADGPLDRSDRIVQEKAERFTKFVGTARPTGTAGELAIVGPEGGSPIEFNLRWTFTDTDSWAWFVYNMGPQLTTGATIRVVATHYGVWV